MMQFMRRWKGELVAAVMAAIGILLLIERFDLGATFGERMTGIAFGIWSGIRSVINVIRATQPSDAAGIALVVGAVVLLVRRAGQRMQQSPEWTNRSCPRCGRGLRRIGRRRTDVLTWILPLRRYQCRNCGWTGYKARSLEPDELADLGTSRRTG